MARVVNFYEKLPRGAAPAPKARGPLQWYQHRYMVGKNASAMRTLYHTQQQRSINA
jgi:F-type H+-transporting ATPase subunit f